MKRLTIMYTKLFFAAIILLFAVPLSASTDVRFLRGLIDRNLFESVERFCSDEFRAKKTDLPRKLALATEWVRSRTRQMILSPPEHRATIRKRLAELETELLAAVTSETDPELVLSFHFQLAISDASLGDWLRLEADAATEDEHETKINEARKILFDALERFKRCDEEITALRRRSTGDISFEKRTLALLWAIRSQWSMAQVSLALSYPTGNDRTFSLNRAVELLSELAGLGISDPVVFRSRIELARCYRLLGEMEKSKEQLVILDGIRLTGETLLLAQAELIRHYLSMGAVLEAMKFFDAKTSSEKTAECPDFDIARLELLLAEIARIRQANAEKPEAQKEGEAMLGRILEQVHQIDRQFGPYWGRRARMVLSSSEDERGTADAALIRLLGDERFQSGYPSEAVRLYDRASRIAESQGDEVTAFACGSASVAVWAEILDRLTVRLKNADGVSSDEAAATRQRLIDSARNLAIRFPEHLDSPEYHLKAVDLTAEAVRLKQSELSAYVELLKEHAERWPDSRKVPPALLRAALLVEQQGDMTEALAILERIPIASDAGLKAIQAAQRCFEALTEDDNEITQKEAEWFEKRLGKTASDWNEAEVSAAFRAVECRLKIFAEAEDKTQVVEYPKAAEKLLRGIEQASNLSTTSKARCQAQLVRALADQGRSAEAAEVLQNFGDERIKDLTPEERRVFQRTRARLLDETGKTQDAVNLLAALLKRYPNDLAVWETLAEVLTRQNDEKSLNRALQYWSKIVVDLEAKSDAKSERWWTARERMLDIRLKLGQPDEAKNEFEVLQLLHPELGGPARKARLEKRFGKE